MSKGLLLGNADPASVYVHPSKWYADQQVDLIPGTPVTDLDLDTGHVTFGSRRVSYHRLLWPHAPSPDGCR